ncbi:VOC family protein [Chryseolinea lacunae]|uniref:VOC family protein n=1 Tax=Chryseolinea lacunae TaxID=2801331 RepID=A0ABS1KM69_9BACT|nr:VOC family protein [Chryseolinea lacunae]MBL0740546.1 VOC family protein [Chryseolinea lacunae]
MTKVNPYLFFDGNCEEAFLFYKSVFRREFNYLGRYKDVPKTDRHIFAAHDEKIMHVTLPISDETTLMGSDHAESHSASASGPVDNFALYINTDSRAEADRLFSELSVGGDIKVPMTETFWGSYYGIFKDRFGINWKITFDLPR